SVRPGGIFFSPSRSTLGSTDRAHGVPDAARVRAGVIAKLPEKPGDGEFREARRLDLRIFSIYDFDVIVNFTTDHSATASARKLGKNGRNRRSWIDLTLHAHDIFR